MKKGLKKGVAILLLAGVIITGGNRMKRSYGPIDPPILPNMCSSMVTIDPPRM